MLEDDKTPFFPSLGYIYSICTGIFQILSF